MTVLGINCDCGESFGRLSVGRDDEVIPLIDSANIACGFHGGDPTTIRQTVRLALKHNVACGAHPSLPDLMGFGRRVMSIDPAELTDLLIYQIGAVKVLIESEGGECLHVKPHGVLYSMLYRDELAEAFADAIEAVNPEMVLVCEQHKPTAEVARRRGLKTIFEFTADRPYDGDGNLVITRRPESVDPEFAVGQVRQLVETGSVKTTAGTPFEFSADLICMHSDTPNSAEVAKSLRGYLDSLT